ncbi:beta-lactamase family protein [Kineosporia sp. J2-2]|uniref:Beta-lactamase family protein n=1 Tax=Kineosporia corallincola TaxID=2835133 RepID=A0ABS5THB9_9ACTN|nr:serine hydrolase domain-containing protein [Kineosporia corallincola]MBT0768999.1 beta-lactamase family protein [Kineosporia corallincola]
MPADESIAPSTARHLLAATARVQRESRLPSLVAGVTRGGRLVWSGTRGTVRGAEPGVHTPYRIGSITKTMTAVLVLRLRDEGLVALDDPIEKHVPGLPFGDRTVGQLLAHESGLRAEAPTDWWERVAGLGWDELAARLRADDVLFPAGRRFHYSNLGYAVLGELVARTRGRSWFHALHRELLEPLGMRHTSYLAGPHAADGWAVHPWADLVLPEPAEDAGAMAPAGQLWSTVADLGRFAGLLLNSVDGGVLSASSLSEMGQATGVDAAAGRRGYGLGIFTYERGGGVVLGHGGSMPGFVSGLFVDPAQQTGAVVLTNSTNGGETNGLAMALLDIMREHEPYLGPTWTPAEQPDDEALALTGPWYWGPNGLGLRLTGTGDLIATGLAGTATRAGVFRRDADGEWTGLEGYHQGERLRPVRDAEGRVVALDIGTFVFTRTPYDPAAPVPGGVHPKGWQVQGPQAGAPVV